MNVLYLHNTSQISGGERSLLALWENLDRTKFKLFLAVPQEGALTEKARALGVGYVVWSVPVLRPWNVHTILRAKQELERIVAEKNIGLVHSYTPRNNLIASLVGRKMGVPVVWHERNLIYGFEWDVSAAFAQFPDAIICNSQAVARRFRRGGKVLANVVAILNGVDTARFQPSEMEEAKRRLGLEGRKVVGLVSNLNLRKNVEQFIRVAGSLAPKEPLVSFVVVGGMFGEEDGGRMDELKTLAERSGIGNRIIFTGFQENVRPYLAAFDVYCSVTVREACSRALLEAMSMGKPCVAFNDGGNPEIVEDGVTGLLVPVNDDAKFLGALEKLLSDRDLCRQHGQAARARVVDRFSVQKNATVTQELYLRLLQGRRIL